MFLLSGLGTFSIAAEAMQWCAALTAEEEAELSFLCPT